MSGTKEGGAKASETNRKKYGENFYKEIGAIGGSKKNPDKGFGSKTPEERREAGRKGGTISRRGKSIKYDLDYEDIHSKTETKKRVYDTSNLGVDSNSVHSPVGKLSRAFNNLVRK